MYPIIDCYALHTSSTRKNRLVEKTFFSCVTQQDISGVLLKTTNAMVTNKTDIVRFHRFAHHRRI